MNVNEISPYIRVAMRSYLEAPFKINRRILFDYEIILIEKGTWKLIFDDTSIVCQQNDIILLRPGISHQIESIGSGVSQPHIHFDLKYEQDSEQVFVSFKDEPGFTEEEKKMIRPDLFGKIIKTPILSVKNPERFKKLLFSVIDVFERRKDLFQLQYKSLMNEMIYMILESYADIAVARQDNDIIMLIKEYIDHNFYNRITLETLEKQFHYNKFYIEKKFKNAQGIPIKKYYNQLRYEAIQDAFKQGYSVTQTAEMFNFNSIYTFSRFFKTISGISPTEYIKNNR